MLNLNLWNRLLQTYVDDDGRVNYRAWQTADQRSLTQWLNDLNPLDWLSASNRDEQLASWINLYNALAIAQVLQLYPISSIQPKILGIPNWLAFLWFFLRPVYVPSRIGEKRRYSLNDIEHRILRQQFQDPRIHFALVCASIGCPLLRNHAYAGDRVQTQLEEDARRFVNNPAKVHYDSHRGVLHCSKIFKWYRQDFLAIAPSIPDYIRLYLDREVPMHSKTPVRYLPYDWGLNQL